MATYAYQVETTRGAHMASRALADAAIVDLQDFAERMSKGKMTLAEYRNEARRLVRKSYRGSASVARNLTQQLSELPGWEPQEALKHTDYLDSLLKDVDRNIETFKNSTQTNKDLRALSLRVQLSAITAAERGFTDAQLAHYAELEVFGYRVSKLWLANFLNNEPCVDCVLLHGTQVDFNQEFPIPTLMRSSVYRDLQGPPLHVRCKCMMVVLISSAENILDSITVDAPQAPTPMSVKVIQRMSKKIFDDIIKVIRLITRRKQSD